MKAIGHIFNVGAVAICLTALSSPAKACGVDAMMGSICFTSSYYCPQNFLPAQGQLLNIAQHPALYTLIGKKYGGDGTTSFALPDLRGKSGFGLACITVIGLYPMPK